VFLGILTKLVFHLSRGVSVRNIFKMDHTLETIGESKYVLTINGSALFSNFIGLKKDLAEIPHAKQIQFNLSEAQFIDHTVMEYISQFKQEYELNGGLCEILGLEAHEPLSKHPLAARRNLGRKAEKPGKIVQKGRDILKDLDGL
jgi:MFS superfamily sulfate permease-like transporter